jgi:orotate phosphoribosyltransferase-like protein
MTKHALRDQAIELRKQHFSLKNIAQTLQISKSTASMWLRNFPPIPKEIFLKTRKGRRIAFHSRMFIE